VAGLRAAMGRLLTDPELRRRMGRAARERVAARCSWETVTAATLAAYGEPHRERVAAPRIRQVFAGTRRERQVSSVQ
jgi:hypothetical protein